MAGSANDTIFALATPPGRSALGVIRLSGPEAHDALRLFGCQAGAAGRASRVFLKDSQNTIIDDVITLAFQGPASPTGEDVLEIYCHGSFAVIADILGILGRADGFRAAEAGEFTRRAIDHDKMDITAAEGLADLIEAETVSQRRLAAAQLAGQLNRPVSFWRDEIIQLLGQLEAAIDFADEELPDNLITQIQARTARLCTDLADALDDSHAGEIIRNGLAVALIGPVNAGKSTLLNLLAGREAAIVSERAGTTRDIIEVRLTVSGIAVIVSDTAGWRLSDDEIENEGINRAKIQAARADLVLIVSDGSKEGWAAEAEALQEWTDSPVLHIISRADKGRTQDSLKKGSRSVFVDLRDQASAAPIIAALQAYLAPLNQAAQSAIITRARHREALSTALCGLQAAGAHDFGTEIELVAENYRAAAAALGRLSGHIDAEELLDHIFSRFCIGK